MILALFSCTGKQRQTNIYATQATLIDILNEDSELTERVIGNNCVTDRFQQGQADHLYGIECIKDKYLVIKTTQDGELVSNTKASESSGSLTIEEGVDFVNEVYNVSYRVKRGEGDDDRFPFLLDFFTEGEEFLGSKDTEYRIVFKLEGDYLVLSKAVPKDRKLDLPYTQWSSLTEDKGYYMVPLIGYPLEYCEVEAVVNEHGEETYRNRVRCYDKPSEDTKYIRANHSNKQRYEYLSKEDVYPSSYFDGEWFFAEGVIEAKNSDELEVSRSFLIEIDKRLDELSFLDASSEVEEQDREDFYDLPVQWKDFKRDKDDNGKWRQFGERLNEQLDDVTRPFVQIDFSQIGEATEVVIDKDYFSFVIQAKVKNSEEKEKRKLSLLRSTAFDSEGFKPQQWFLQDFKEVFGFYPISPTSENPLKVIGKSTTSDLLEDYRVNKFNISLNTDEEKASQTKVINWHFSKNSTDLDEFRIIARQAIDAYDRAFEVLFQDQERIVASGAGSKKPRIKVQLLEEGGDKSLGDLRYNLINLLRPPEVSRTGLLGVVPRRSNPKTGQVVSSVANVLASELEESFNRHVREYIRWEIFQRDKRSEKENQVHVVTPELRAEIKDKCEKVTQFIEDTKGKVSNPRTELDDEDLRLSCAKELAKPRVLWTLLHELGHSFGLGHNPACSSDSKNFYASLEEIENFFPVSENSGYIKTQTVPKTACVMDYPDQTKEPVAVLGKQDLAALRYLYYGQVKEERGDDFVIHVHDQDQDPENQTALFDSSLYSLDVITKYLHCDDVFSINERSLCLFFDYGSTPLETVENSFESVRRSLNKRYRYDDAKDVFVPNLYRIIGNQNFIPSVFYLNHWRSARNEFIDSRPDALGILQKITFDDTISEEYLSLLEEGLETNEKLRTYFPVRSAYIDFFQELLALEAMTCHLVENSNPEETHKVNLSYLKNQISPALGKDFFVTDCYSDQIKNFIELQDMKLVGQSGLENFVSYEEQVDGVKPDPDVKPLVTFFLDPTFTFGILGQFHKNFLDGPYQWTEEPDLIKNFYKKYQSLFLDFNYHSDDLSLLKTLSTLEMSYGKITAGLEKSNYSHFLKDYGQDFLGQAYNLDKTASASFFQLIEQHLSDEENNPILSESPFLKESYEQYKANQQTSNYNSFQDYLLSRSDTTQNTSPSGTTLLYIPFKPDSLFSKIVRNYNQTLDEIDELTATTNKDFLQIYRVYLLTQYSSNLISFIKVYGKEAGTTSP